MQKNKKFVFLPIRQALQRQLRGERRNLPADRAARRKIGFSFEAKIHK
jgi:hypothetical protein